MLSGIEMYYFTSGSDIKMNFKSLDEQKTLVFYLVSSVSLKKVIITIDNIPLTCSVTNVNKLNCPVIAKGFVQERKHLYQPYLLDSNQMIKKNYFINPIEITLEYIN